MTTLTQPQTSGHRVLLALAVPVLLLAATIGLFLSTDGAGLNVAPAAPVAMDQASLDLYKTFVDKPGINSALANLANSLTESLAKKVPNYVQARWEGKPGIDIGENKDVNIGWMMDHSWTGEYKFEDYAAKLQTYANGLLADGLATIRDK